MSATVTKTATIPVITRTGIEIFETEEKNASKIPHHASGGPGITGKIVPIKPAKSKIPVKTAKNIPVTLFLTFFLRNKKAT